MKVIEGDLITMSMRGDFEIIVHGMNCFHEWDSGIRKDISSVFPNSLTADKLTKYGDPKKLGDYSISDAHHNGLRVINAYTQYGFGNDGKEYVDVVALNKVFERIKLDFKQATIAFPRIGSGSGGGCFDYLGNFILSHMGEINSALIVPPRPIRRSKRRRNSN